MTSGPEQQPTVLEQILHFGPHEGAHRVAVRAGISVLVPLLLLQFLGRPEWSIYAVFGAFTSLYGRERVDRPRVVLQATAGTILSAMVVLGAVVAISPERSWLSVPVATVVAIVTTYLSFRQNWHPPGSLFPVFAFSAVAAAPGTLDAVPVAAAVAGGSALFALAVGNAGALVARVRRTASVAEPNPPIGGSTEGMWRQVALSGVGVAVAGGIATASHIGRPYWAMVGAVVPLAAPTVTGQIVRGSHRLIGTFLGLGLSFAVLAPDLSALTLVLVATVLQVGAELFVGRNYALALVFVTPLALLMTEFGSPTPVGELVFERGIETLIGVVVGLLVGLVGRRVWERGQPSGEAP